jgi:hypothetical protein
MNKNHLHNIVLETEFNVTVGGTKVNKFLFLLLNNFENDRIADDV